MKVFNRSIFLIFSAVFLLDACTLNSNSQSGVSGTVLASKLSATAATIINAASCSASDVQTAFNGVTAATTMVNIPACSAGVGWSTPVTLTVPSGNTNLSVIGAGNLTATGGGDQTVIIDNYASTNALLTVTTNAASSSQFRLAGMTFQGGSAGVIKYNGIVVISGNSANTRLDHIHFNDLTYNPAETSSMVQYEGCVYGVIDHSIFDGPAGLVSNAVRIYNSGSCYGDILGVGDQSWAHSTSLGSANFLFMENNIFNSGASDDCTDGGRFVSRFNTFNTTSPAPTVQTHPTGGGGRIRGCRAWEVYGNQFDAVAGNYINSAVWISSGTGVVWGNTTPSSSAGGATGYHNFLELLSMRQDNTTYPQAPTPNGWGYCGTTFNGTGSNWDQNSNVSSGYHCLDQPGQGIGDLLAGGFSSDGSGSNNVTNTVTGCTASSACAWPRQALEPIYEWMDAYSTVPNNPSVLIANESSTAFFSNSEYYGWCNPSSTGGCTNFTGASTVGSTTNGGVGSGPLGSRPPTCTTGVGYWATDQGSWNQSGSGGQGELFICTATNTWTLSYTPYTYPHPLVSGNNTTPTASPSPTSVVPNPPTNLRVLSFSFIKAKIETLIASYMEDLVKLLKGDV